MKKYTIYAVQHRSVTRGMWIEFVGKYKSLNAAIKDAKLGASKLRGRKFRALRRVVEEYVEAEFSH